MIISGGREDAEEAEEDEKEEGEAGRQEQGRSDHCGGSRMIGSVCSVICSGIVTIIFVIQQS